MVLYFFFIFKKKSLKISLNKHHGYMFFEGGNVPFGFEKKTIRLLLDGNNRKNRIKDNDELFSRVVSFPPKKLLAGLSRTPPTD